MHAHMAPTMTTHDVIHKPEVHNVAQHRQRMTEPRPQGICTQNFVQIGKVVPEICSQTDRQTDKHTDAQTDGLITILRSPTGAE